MLITKKLFEKKNILNLNEIGELMRNQWALKKHLSNKVSNTKINQLYNFINFSEDQKISIHRQ